MKKEKREKMANAAYIVLITGFCIAGSLLIGLLLWLSNAPWLGIAAAEVTWTTWVIIKAVHCFSSPSSTKQIQTTQETNHGYL